MEAFFDREAKRLEFTAERTIMRANEKRTLDSVQTDKEQVCLQCTGTSLGHSPPICSLLRLRLLY